MNIIIVGANGFLGKGLIAYFVKKENVNCFQLVRNMNDLLPKDRTIIWDGKILGPWVEDLEKMDVIINLAGKSVDCRYTFENKAEIYSSRIVTTNLLNEAVKKCKNKPKLWMNAASATIYEHSIDRPNTEENNLIGHGFSVDVCKRWEGAFFAENITDVRKIALRTAIVLGKNGGALKPMIRLAKFGLGGKMGSGKQMFSWIHEEDFYATLWFLIESKGSEGVYNLSSPEPISNKQIMQCMRKVLKVPFGLPTPKFLLNMGAKLIGTEPELILKSRYVLPEKLQDSGYNFQFPDIKSALENILIVKKI